jgi:hypothetical protein
MERKGMKRGEWERIEGARERKNAIEATQYEERRGLETREKKKVCMPIASFSQV